MYAKSLIFAILLCIVPTLVKAQTYVYSYADPCTGNIKTINVPTSGVTVTYFGKMNTFSPADFTNGTFDNWANGVYSSFGGNNPCGSTIGVSSSISMAQNSAMNVLGIMNSLSAISDIASSMGGGLNTNGVTESSKTEGKSSEKKNDKKNNSDGSTSGSNGSTTGGSNGSTTTGGSNGSNTTGGSNGSTTTGGTTTGSNGSTTTGGTTTGSNGSTTTGSNGSTTTGGGTTGSNGSTTTGGGTTGSNGSTTTGGGTTGSNGSTTTGSNGSTTGSNGSTTGSNGSTTTESSTGGSTTTGGTTTSGTGNGSGSGSTTTGGSGSGSGNGSTNNNNNSTGSDAATSEEKKSSNILGGSVGSIQNSTSTSTTSSKGGSSPTKGNAPTIVLSSDFAGFNFKQGDVNYGGKGTAGWTSLNWDGSRSHGFMLDYTSANKGPNFTAFFATIKKRRINLISVTGTTSFYGKGSLYGTVALGQMWSFSKVKNLKAIYMATSSYGNVYGTKFIGTAFIAGGMYDFKVGKRTQIKLTNLFIYAPYISYYNDMVLKSPYVIMPIIGTNIGVTKKFKLNVNLGGTYALGENVLNFTVMMGTRFAL